ncbi:MAG: hypothetical protein ACXV3V_03140 [Actinomycetes bacterium]
MPETTYEVRVSGLVPEDALEDFGDVNVTTTSVCTVLSGSLTDQAALLGLLARLSALGLNVMEVRRVLGAPDVESEAESEVRSDTEAESESEVESDTGAEADTAPGSASD